MRFNAQSCGNLLGFMKNVLSLLDKKVLAPLATGIYVVFMFVREILNIEPNRSSVEETFAAH